MICIIRARREVLEVPLAVPRIKSHLSYTLSKSPNKKRFKRENLASHLNDQRVTLCYKIIWSLYIWYRPQPISFASIPQKIYTAT